MGNILAYFHSFVNAYLDIWLYVGIFPGMNQAEARRGLLGDLLAIIALIALAIILLWGAYHLFGLARNWFSSAIPGDSSRTALVVSAPAEVRSGTSFDISWKNDTGTEGHYAIAYQCKPNLSFKTKNAQGAVEPIPCGTAYRIPAESGTSMTIMPSLTGNASTTVPFSILLAVGTSSPSVVAQGNGLIGVLPGVALENVAGESGSPSVPARSGPPDLTVRIISVGFIDPATDSFVVGAPTMPGALSAVQFDIINVGSGSTGTWAFSATLPTASGYVYRSPSQSPLGPGDRILNTLRFSGTAVNGGTFTVTASDSGDMNTKNDTATVFVPGNSYPAGYQYVPQYQGGYPQTQYEYIYQD